MRKRETLSCLISVLSPPHWASLALVILTVHADLLPKMLSVSSELTDHVGAGTKEGQ